MIKNGLFILLFISTSSSFANIWTDPITVWPFAGRQKLSAACQEKLNLEIQKARKATQYPDMGLRKSPNYPNGISYYQGPTAHKINLQGVIYRGSGTVFSADVLIPISPCNHVFEYWKGELDSIDSCKIKSLNHKIDKTLYNGCGG